MPLPRRPSPWPAYPAKRVKIMSKSQNAKRDEKKKPTQTPKEKKVAKRAKKHAGDSAPMIAKSS